jgi:hypothetical protein
MRLIEVAAINREFCPPIAASAARPEEGTVEARDARHCFRCEADLFVELGYKMLAARS